jgi:hypothetical protein
MLTLEHVRTIRVLMARASLKGDEVPAFSAALAALEALDKMLSSPPPSPPSAEGGGGGS